MSHHASGPDFGSPHGDARLDITDVYAFPKPGDAMKSILILNVHPSFAVNPRGPTTREPFAPGALYEFHVDNNGDAVVDLRFSFCFRRRDEGTQIGTLTRTYGSLAQGYSSDGDVIADEICVSAGREALITNKGEYRLFAGWRGDPFFFDADGLFNNMQFTGNDFFLDKDVCSIVLELPNADLGAGSVGLWARTCRKTDEGWVQADRGGRPLQAVFLPGDHREAYLSGQPADDQQFIAPFAHTLEHSGGYSHEEAKAVAARLLPDILAYDPSKAAEYPRNGRTLTDDVTDRFFSILTNGRITTDYLGPHSDLLESFPYVGPPHVSM